MSTDKLVEDETHCNNNIHDIHRLQLIALCDLMSKMWLFRQWKKIHSANRLVFDLSKD